MGNFVLFEKRQIQRDELLCLHEDLAGGEYQDPAPCRGHCGQRQIPVHPKNQGSLILGRPFSVVAESHLRVSHDTVPFTVGSNDGPDELSSFYFVFVGGVKIRRPLGCSGGVNRRPRESKPSGSHWPQIQVWR